uniref:CUB domain-containing protein n=1 Tax=Rhabditophanes sp. KR3021 TaxID=114890 RepID=A0AC35TWQ9_9BILA
MLSFEAPQTATSSLDSLCGSSCNEDFVQFMPITSQPIECNSLLLAPDQRMITSHFTTRLHLSPPNSGINCNAISKITVYEDTNNVQGSEQVVDKMGYTQISLMGKQSAAFSTYDGQMSTNRFGSTFEQDNSTANGHFMHYVPSTSEWVTGKTQFYILAKDCILELYADAIGSNPDIIKIDGHNISTLKYERKLLPFFKMQYAQFTVQMKGYGLHTIENDGNYVAFVICKKVNGPYNAYGYLTGFNQRKPN